MALLNCGECGRQISSNAAACPHCGNPNKPARVNRTKRSRRLVLGGIATTLLVGGAVAVVLLVNPDTDVAATEETDVSQPVPPCAVGTSQSCICPDEFRSVSSCTAENTWAPCECDDAQRGYLTGDAELAELVQTLRAQEWPWSPPVEVCTLLISSADDRKVEPTRNQHESICSWLPNEESGEVELLAVARPMRDGRLRLNLRASTRGDEDDSVIATTRHDLHSEAARLTATATVRRDGLVLASIKTERPAPDGWALIDRRELLVGWSRAHGVPLAVADWRSGTERPVWSDGPSPLGSTSLQMAAGRESCQVTLTQSVVLPLAGPLVAVGLKVEDQLLPFTFYDAPVESHAMPVLFEPTFDYPGECDDLNGRDLSTLVVTSQTQDDNRPRAGSAHAQADGPRIGASFVSTSLDGEAGGPTDGTSLAGGCVGYVAIEPNHLMTVDAEVPLELSVDGRGEDLTLIVRDGSGRYRCNDDSQGVDPSVVGVFSGRLEIWVGTFVPNQPSSYTLSLARSAPPTQAQSTEAAREHNPRTRADCVAVCYSGNASQNERRRQGLPESAPPRVDRWVTGPGYAAFQACLRETTRAYGGVQAARFAVGDLNDHCATPANTACADACCRDVGCH